MNIVHCIIPLGSGSVGYTHIDWQRNTTGLETRLCIDGGLNEIYF